MKKNEIQKERYKLQATKIEKQRHERQNSRFELFYENIAQAIISLEQPKIKREILSDNDNEYLVGLGDIHYGANFNSANNVYSRQECRRRFGVLLSELEKFIEKEDISHIKILNVSDTIQGILRMTDLQINDIPVVDCVVEVSRLIAEFLNELSASCNITYYHVPKANHSQTRPLGSKASEIASEDMEKIIVNYISDLLANNPRVTVISNLEKDYVDFKIFDFECTSLHGHQIKNPKTSVKDLSNINRKWYSYVFLGHTHSANETIVGEENHNNIEVLTIPSFIGSDPYADSLFVGSKAMVKIFEFNRTYGHIGSKYIILN